MGLFTILHDSVRFFTFGRTGGARVRIADIDRGCGLGSSSLYLRRGANNANYRPGPKSAFHTVHGGLGWVLGWGLSWGWELGAWAKVRAMAKAWVRDRAMARAGAS